MGQMWTPDASGGYLANTVLSKKIRHQIQPLMKAKQFPRPEPGFGKGKGDTINFNRVANVAIGGGRISELEKVPEDSYAITQGSVVVDEWGNSVPYTGKLETLAEFDVSNITQKALMNDSSKVLDQAVITELETSALKYTPTGTETVPTGTFGTSVTTATRHVQAFDVKELVDGGQSTYLMPPYDGENYMILASKGFARKLMDDPDWEDAAKYGDPQRLFSGEAGRYYSARVVVETNGISNVLGTTSYKGEAIFFGDDPIVEGVALGMEIRAKVSTDYGRDKGLCWYFLGEWGLTYDVSTAGMVKSIQVSAS